MARARTMRILHCSDSFWPRSQGIGGIQVWLSHLCRQQVADGHTVGVATWPWEGSAAREVWQGVEVWRWPVSADELIQSPGKLPELLRAALAAKKSFRPDVIHVHLNQLASWINTLGEKMARTVLTFHVPVCHDGMPLMLQQRVLADAEAVVVPSNDLLLALEEHAPGLRAKLQVIPHGLGWPDQAPAPICAAPLTFLCLGRVIPEKGFDVVLRALAATDRSDFRLIIGGSGAALPSLRNLAAELGISHQVDFRGWVHPDQVAALINEAAVILMPSLWREPFGLVALQAAQMGRPVLASRVGGLSEVVVDEVTGRLLAPGDTSVWARAMVELSENPARLSLWGDQASTRARRHFSIAACAASYLSTYRGSVAASEGPADE